MQNLIQILTSDKNVSIIVGVVCVSSMFAHLSGLPVELHVLVHDFLTFPRYDSARYCVVHDGGAAFRCACSQTRASVPPPNLNGSYLPCCSVARVVHKRLQLPLPSMPPPGGKRKEICCVYDCNGASVNGCRYNFQPTRLCVAHDCCSDELDDEDKMVHVAALQSFLEQLKEQKPAISCVFPSWFSLSHFPETMRRAGVRLYGYKAVMTRQKEGVRVSWLKSNPN